MKFTEWGDEFEVEVPLDKADAGQYDALVLPGGVMNPDKLRMIPTAVEFVRQFFEAHNRWQRPAVAPGH